MKDLRGSEWTREALRFVGDKNYRPAWHYGVVLLRLPQILRRQLLTGIITERGPADPHCGAGTSRGARDPDHVM